MTARIELVPTLEHCIETTARQEFSRSADAYMQQGEGDRKLEQRIELLRAFLETADFKKLRRESEKHLAEGKPVRFLLYTDKGHPKYEMKVEH
ncbi:MAG TPA: hypothetical protein G4O13_06685 [Dehalococcoidia bacterium]|nr:hypothetical protein [Dehalococcoidia bacterium]